VTRTVGVGLLAAAFAPMVALLAVLRLDDLGRWGLVILAACVLAEALLYFVLRALRGIGTRTVESTSVRRADERVLAFTSGYVAPLVVAAFGKPQAPTIIATAALVVVLAVIYVRAGLYHLNPVLAMLGFRLYEVTIENGSVTLLLTHADHLAQAGPIRCQYLSDDTAIQFGARP
jgi:hypothetical protein